jgi:hypothetical protein
MVRNSRRRSSRRVVRISRGCDIAVSGEDFQEMRPVATKGEEFQEIASLVINGEEFQETAPGSRKSEPFQESNSTVEACRDASK